MPVESNRKLHNEIVAKNAIVALSTFQWCVETFSLDFGWRT